MVKQEEYVFCVDSDGCAMDTMTYKHQLFFGPLAAQFFEVPNKEAFLKEWDNINLYSRTRGVNRFVGLAMGLEYAGLDGIDALKHWVATTSSLSNASLEKALDQKPSDDLQKALDWSNEVNRQIKSYKGEALAFTGARSGLARLHELGKVYVVSSANHEAVEEEWRDQGLLEHVDELYCQDRGKKEDVIAALVEQGYVQEHILMIGDSPGDLAAAEQNQVAFYPILVGKEAISWKELQETFSPAFVAGQVTKEDLEKLKETFWKHLD
ncbi:HAD hydrolase-like protein [Streptococcus sp. zg-86]|uniref:HAD hydrolase-like protein n=1 Tax=Streptococcus zhangguiae TaxID=2664091 RepID=A0A6I4RTZ3_9STRE|nr:MULTISPECIES: HAD hydrolase-like protein [unclassified Streptococcus]MTB64535.1 HAD hydrolase-like protein [Streptococcus sp. zg-86]MTB90775.1 HAD hydrolase-like protein [Streptococcus sp. zg-36]MWV56522.1 HAD hydrolase-like protein [Streptococcus sp. zg-70]QTH47272.1 HAD family hydrolase [Streptococcus sp. zg-86]